MSSKTCKDCRYFVQNDYSGCCTLLCDVTCDDDSACIHFAELTVFDKITESSETLAEKLLYEILSTDPVFGCTYYGWCSTIIPGEKWVKREEAITATLAKLKKVVE